MAFCNKMVPLKASKKGVGGKYRYDHMYNTYIHDCLLVFLYTVVLGNTQDCKM